MKLLIVDDHAAMRRLIGRVAFVNGAVELNHLPTTIKVQKGEFNHD